MDIDLNAKIVQFDKVVVAKAGSKLGAFFSASASAPAVSSSILEGKGFFAGALHCDAASLGAFVKDLLAELRKSPEIAELIPADVTDPWTDLGWWSGKAAMSMGTTGDSLFATDSVMAFGPSIVQGRVPWHSITATSRCLLRYGLSVQTRRLYRSPDVHADGRIVWRFARG